jgi:hypothetical protein
MFIQFLIVFILSILAIYCINKFIKHKILIDDRIKYNISDSDINLIKQNGKEMNEIPEKDGIFYTSTKWSTKNNNYLLYNDKYYIIEPGYYYVTKKNVKFFINNLSIVFMEDKLITN